MKNIIIFLTGLILFLASYSRAQEPTRIGTTAASFLEYGYSTAGNAMGDAYVSIGRDLASIYWNPASGAYMEKNQVYFMYQPWLANINTSYASAGVVVPNMGTLALSVISVDYGDMPVTNLAMQEGTGELFSATDMAFSLTFSRSLATWFSFGATGKWISSKIWHTNANAIAMDLGVIINTGFFSPNDDRKHGLNIGMSISNYGTRMQYDGIDLINPIDINLNESGNFRDVPGQFRLSKWELPLMFRIGASIKPFVTEYHELILAFDALHPNNNSESVNIGAQYSVTSHSFGRVFLRGGYKALFMKKSEYGAAFGFGVETFMLYNTRLKLEFAFRAHRILGNVKSFSVGFAF